MVSVMVSQRFARELSWREYRVEFLPIRTDMSGEIQLWFVGAVVGIGLPLAHFAFEDEHQARRRLGVSIPEPLITGRVGRLVGSPADFNVGWLGNLALEFGRIAL
jgi:hypothetical protein